MQSPLELIVTVVSHFWIAIDWPELIVLRVVVDPVTKILLVAGAFFLRREDYTIGMLV